MTRLHTADLLIIPVLSGRVELMIDGRTGQLRTLADYRFGDSIHAEIALAMTLETGGVESRGSTGATEITGSDLLNDLKLEAAPGVESVGTRDLVRVRTSMSGWGIEWIWTVDGDRGPLLDLRLVLTPSELLSSKNRTVRNLTLSAGLNFAQPAQWTVSAPGNRLRRDVRIGDLPATTRIEAPAGQSGSSGLLRFFRDDGVSFVMWPLCRSELADISLATSADSTTLELSISTNVNAAVPEQESLVYDGLLIDIQCGTRDSFEETVQRWYRSLGITAPPTPSPWLSSALIYEVFVGRAVFWGNTSYAGYPTVDHIRRDLERIQALGFTALQLMPRQPYPSYNVHDYSDIDTTYGDEAQLRELVAECHRRGMHLILDVVMHGVLDRQSIAEAARGVRDGPFMDSLDDDPGDLFDLHAEARNSFEISWSRHILDYEPHWSAGAPEVNQLVVEHPSWFYRGSNGQLLGMYTRAFDVRNRELAEWFVERMEELVDRLDIDGIRIDAPTYNRFGNWSESTRRRASLSVLACLQLFPHLRRRLQTRKSDFALYTEPSGILHRESMDLSYSYDEQWIISAILQPDPVDEGWAVRNAGEALEWIVDRDALLPPGSATCHHIDSHDTFWWPNWGHKWRREQFDPAAVRATQALFFFLPGAFMTFAGGEAGLETELTFLSSIRRRLPHMAGGALIGKGASASDARVVTIVRGTPEAVGVVAINFSDQEVLCELSLDIPIGEDVEWREIVPSVSDGMAESEPPLQEQPGHISLAPWEYKIFSTAGASIETLR